MSQEKHGPRIGREKSSGRRAAALAALLLLGVAVSGTAPALAGNANPGVLPPGSRSHGTTYAELSGAWWQWALAGTTADNPVADTTGVNCGVRQSGSIWFLAGTFGGGVTRTCQVPSGKALFFPLVNTVWANDPGGAATVEELRELANADLAGATASAEIDGTSVAVTEDYLVESTVFDLALTADNVLGAPAGTYAPAVAAGFHLLLAPLSRGPHELHFEGCFANGFCVEATYHLIVSKS